MPKLYFNSLCQQLISYRGRIFWNKVSNSLKNIKQSLGSLQKPSEIGVQVHKVINCSSISAEANLSIKRYSLLQ